MAEYINRDDLLKAAWDKPTLSLSVYDIGNIKPVDVSTVRHGRWLPQVVLWQKAWDCSECKTLGSPHWKWCPVCGCKMDLEAT